MQGASVRITRGLSGQCQRRQPLTRPDLRGAQDLPARPESQPLLLRRWQGQPALRALPFRAARSDGVKVHHPRRPSQRRNPSLGGQDPPCALQRAGLQALLPVPAARHGYPKIARHVGLKPQGAEHRQVVQHEPRFRPQRRQRLSRDFGPGRAGQNRRPFAQAVVIHHPLPSGQGCKELRFLIRLAHPFQDHQARQGGCRPILAPAARIGIRSHPDARPDAPVDRGDLGLAPRA